jgi:hypothetical protein
MTCTCGKPTNGITCDDCWREFWDRTSADRERHDDDHDPAWHGNLASIRNADVECDHG